MNGFKVISTPMYLMSMLKKDRKMSKSFTDIYGRKYNGPSGIGVTLLTFNVKFFSEFKPMTDRSVMMPVFDMNEALDVECCAYPFKIIQTQKMLNLLPYENLRFEDGIKKVVVTIAPVTDDADTDDKFWIVQQPHIFDIDAEEEITDYKITIFAHKPVFGKSILYDNIECWHIPYVKDENGNDKISEFGWEYDDHNDISSWVELLPVPEIGEVQAVTISIADYDELKNKGSI